jgi:anthranilate/para-aminobenzoate synthase component I
VVERDGAVVEEAEAADPLAWIEQFQARYRVAEHPDMPRFAGGLVGYFGYDTVRYIEPKLARCPNPDQMGTPDILLMLSEEVVVFDNLRGRIYIIVHLDPEAGDTPATGQRASTSWWQDAARRAAQSEAGRHGASARPTSSPASARRASRRPWSASRTTSSPATACRWCSPSGCRSPSRRARWTCTGRCAG